MALGKMPRRFWSYTAGKGDLKVEEWVAAREQRIRWLKETLPGLVGFGVVLLLLLVMLLMMLAEFRGFYLDQLWELFTVR
jgi:hypothetical protein